MVVSRNLSYSFHQTPIDSGYDGVVKVTAAGYYGTGSLLYSGQAVLTAAHVLLTDGGDSADDATVILQTAQGTKSLTSSNFLIHPDYDPVNDTNDLAIIFLPQQADVTADRYQLYRSSDEIGAQTIIAGYGRSGIGWTGADPESAPYRYKASNTFDAISGEFVEQLGRTLGWDPDPENLLIADFDSGYPINDTLGRISGTSDLGTGLYEGIIAPGDSGGPAFINGQIAGVANYIVRMEGSYESADTDDELNSSFGELGFWLRVSSEQQWIDQSLRTNYPHAPQTSAEVEKSITEGDNGTSLIYFMVQFHGERDTAQEILSIDYSSRNGTATAGADYLSVSGTLNLYPDENQALIPVEVIGDRVIEQDETFYLDIFNPQGGSFAHGVEILTAMRTIIDDDGWA